MDANPLWRMTVSRKLMERNLMRLGTDALLYRLFLAVAALAFPAADSLGATYRTPNFIVTAPTEEIAEKCGKTAEHFREVLAIEWLGKKMPRWYKPCPLRVKVGQIGAGGATTFAFDRGEVFGWRMNVQGSLERILDSVIPHEVSHTVFACHFRRPLPRWADEGAATLIEHESERRRQAMLLKQVWNTPGRIPLQKLLSIKEYPSDMRHVLTLYAEGYSLADFLVQAGGKTRYLEFLETAHRQGWDRAIEEHYSLKGVNELEGRWNSWVMAGSPQLKIPKDSQLAANETNAAPNAIANSGSFERPVIRGQSPEQTPPAAETRTAAVAPAETPAPKQPIALPRTNQVREEAPGWRQMREQFQDIPDDFLNLGNEPTPVTNSSTPPTAERETVPAPKVFAPNNSAVQTDQTQPIREVAPPTIVPAVPKPPSNQPAFRFELAN